MRYVHKGMIAYFTSVSYVRVTKNLNLNLNLALAIPSGRSKLLHGEVSYYMER